MTNLKHTCIPFMDVTSTCPMLFFKSYCIQPRKNVKLRSYPASPYFRPEERKPQSPCEANMNEEVKGDDESYQAVIRLTALVSLKFNKTDSIKELTTNSWIPELPNGAQPERGVILQLVAGELDSKTRKPKVSKEVTVDFSTTLNKGTDKVTQKVEFFIESSFSQPGAIIVRNKYKKEIFVEGIIIEGFAHFTCNSWVQPVQIDAGERIFFSNKAYLPCETPAGLKELREKDLQQLRGNGEGLRKISDRIYDYDTYNDLGNPDKGIKYARPILGGMTYPHPRRCRTGRPPTKTDKRAESPVQESMSVYAPRDEEMEEQRKEAYELAKLKGMVRNMIPFLRTLFGSDSHGLDIDMHYKKKRSRGGNKKVNGYLRDYLPPNILINFKDFIDDYFRFDRPEIASVSGDGSCMRDDQFGCQTLAGKNPLSIERLTTFPPKSKLDPAIYGPQESAIKEEHLCGHLDGMSVQQAQEENKLFVLDYHDIYLPLLEDINAQGDRKAHASRTIFFLTPLGTLKPIAIELSLPPKNSNSRSKQVLTPPVDATTHWLWQLGKAHVCSNDAGAHQLIHHWLRSHACIEPFIIAAHRQLSKMHPVIKLLAPHMRHTLKVNAMARESLINAEGIIESNFASGIHSMKVASAAYKDWWRFDMEGLPADLIRRGLAVPDSSMPHGLRLLIEDYPYASDGLLVWSAIQTLVKSYVNYYYPQESLVISDNELQSWYKEAVEVGHADTQNASWWPKLTTPDALISILTTIIWITTAHHASANFGQYLFGGYIPSHPPFLSRLVPTPNDEEYEDFSRDPQEYFRSSLPSLFHSTKYMAILDILSSHWPDEEYLGERRDLATWSGEPPILKAFSEFSIELRKIQKEIERRNLDSSLRNRCGAGVAPYELLMPGSRSGVFSNRGVPNSIAI